MGAPSNSDSGSPYEETLSFEANRADAREKAEINRKLNRLNYRLHHAEDEIKKLRQRHE